jgi:hypothetical protein
MMTSKKMEDDLKQNKIEDDPKKMEDETNQLKTT